MPSNTPAEASTASAPAKPAPDEQALLAAIQAKLVANTKELLANRAELTAIRTLLEKVLHVQAQDRCSDSDSGSMQQTLQEPGAATGEYDEDEDDSEAAPPVSGGTGTYDIWKKLQRQALVPVAIQFVSTPTSERQRQRGNHPDPRARFNQHREGANDSDD